MTSWYGKDGPGIRLSENQIPPPPVALFPTATSPRVPVSADVGAPQRNIPFGPNGALRGFIGVFGDPSTGELTVSGSAISVSSLAGFVQSQTGRLVVNKTGLNGLFDFKFRFSAEGASFETEFSELGGQPVPTTALEPLPSLPNAFEQQLGLKLESTKGPVDVLVIESVQKPSEN